MNTKKQEAVRKAYGSLYEKLSPFIDDDGWLKWTDKCPINPVLSDYDYSILHGGYRPFSFEGIENNNGWIAIQSEQDLPKDNGYYWVIRAHSDHVHAEYFYGGFTNYDGYRVTHYKPIIKPLPPIY